MKNVTLPAVIIVLFLAPMIIWKYISDLQTKFTLGMFIIIMTGIYLFFTMKGIVMPTEEKTEYRGLQILLIGVLITIFTSYSFRVLDIIKEIR